jgi:hypothetical protein
MVICKTVHILNMLPHVTCNIPYSGTYVIAEVKWTEHVVVRLDSVQNVG